MKPLVPQKVSAGFGLALIILVANILVTAIEVVPPKIQLQDLRSLGSKWVCDPRQSRVTDPLGAINCVSPKLLKQLTADNPHQQQQLDVLNPLITEKLTNSSETIVLRRNQGFEGAQLQLVSLTLTKPRENQRITYA